MKHPLPLVVLQHSLVKSSGLDALARAKSSSVIVHRLDCPDTPDEVSKRVQGFGPCILLLEESTVSRWDAARRSWSVPQCPIVVFFDEKFVSFHRGISLLRMGCAGILKKCSSPYTVERLVHAVRDGAFGFPRRLLLRYTLSRVAGNAESRRLSNREAEILRLVSERLSNKEISERIGLSEQTVRWHVSNLYVKTGIRGRDTLTSHASSNSTASATPPLSVLPAAKTTLILQEHIALNHAKELLSEARGAVVVRCPADVEQLASCARKFEAPVVVLDTAFIDQCDYAVFAARARSSVGPRVIAAVPPDISVSRAVTLLEAGCLGLVSTDASCAELRRAISAVSAGEVWISRMYLSNLVRLFPAADEKPAFSRREQEIFDLLAHGLSNKEIAARLFISAETLRWHMRNLHAKTGVDGRSELARLAQQVLGGPGDTGPSDRQTTQRISSLAVRHLLSATPSGGS